METLLAGNPYVRPFKVLLLLLYFFSRTLFCEMNLKKKKSEVVRYARGWYSLKYGGGGGACRPLIRFNLICDFLYPISDLTLEDYPLFKTNGRNLYPISEKKAKHTQFVTEMFKIYTRFQTKTAQK